MAERDKYKQYLDKYYPIDVNDVLIGKAKLEGQIIQDMPIYLPVKNLNRHGLIAGATGSGKTKTIQLLAEGLSKQGINVLLMDIKGDLSGLAAKGQSNDALAARTKLLNFDFKPSAYPVEFLSISEQVGIRLRGTISEFGPILFARMLGLNDTQSGIMAVIFKYCSDKDLPLLDLKDLKSVIQYLSTNGRNELVGRYGNFSMNSLSTILRKVIELEQQNAELFFGEPSFIVEDLLQKTPTGLATISILRLLDMQNQPKLFSTFMLSLLNEIYFEFPEIGDAKKPKLVIFIDESHLLFQRASQALLDKIDYIVRLIRSKGVGVIFCTQNPKDIPENILSQLGMKIQHAMRTFTAKDRKAIKLVAENYPMNPKLQIENILTELATGEALVSVLDNKGRPTPTVYTYLIPPESRMGTLSAMELNNTVEKSGLFNKYQETFDRESAYEILKARMEQKVTTKGEETSKQKKSRDQINKKESTKLIEAISKNTMVRQMGRTFLRELIRGIFAIFGFKKQRKKA